MTPTIARKKRSACQYGLGALLAAIVFVVQSTHGAAPVCRIQVVEKGSGWPVPLVELRTTHRVRFVTDNAGVIAFDLPELMGKETWFDVIGQGYEMPKDGFGNRGVRLKPEPGKSLTVQIERAIIARRLGRITGSGLFGESQKLGEQLDWRDADVLGCDSVQNAVHGGRLFWLWGDTTLAHYPLGIFDSSSATTALKPLNQFEPPVRLAFDYFTNATGQPRGVAKMPGDGPTWITGYVDLPDKSGKHRLVASYLKIRGPLTAYEKGLCVWNDETSSFEHLRTLWSKADANAKSAIVPEGHPVFWKDGEGREWVLFGNPFPSLRCPATFEAWQDETKWEVLQPQKSLASATSGDPVKPHTGSIAWHPWRNRWVTIFMENAARQSLGNLWYAEADSPTGPWGKAVQDLSHENYTFYNPRVHSEWFDAKSPVLIFEGTYTMQFANHPEPTPRYDYNQILYRLDLDSEALKAAR